MDSEEKEKRLISIKVEDLSGDVVFTAYGFAEEKTTFEFIEYIGRAFIPREPPVHAMRAHPGAPRMSIARISCDRKEDCTDFIGKCSDCAENKAKSYFKPKDITDRATRLLATVYGEATPLRTCLDCGRKAFNDEDLEAFAKSKRCKHGRQNLCKDCTNRRARKRHQKRASKAEG